MRRLRRWLLPVAILGALALVAGCESDDGDDGSNGEPGTGLAENCESRCEDKAESCGAPAGEAGPFCVALCGEGVTEEQARCLERSDCDELGQSFEAGELPCGIGEETGDQNGPTDPADEVAQDCADRCATKAEDCGAPTSVAEQSCADLCALEPTNAELACIEAETCENLQAAFLGGAPVCGISP